MLGASLDNVDSPPTESYAKLQSMKAQVVGLLWTNGTKNRRGVWEELERRLDKPNYVLRIGPSGRCTATEWLRYFIDAYVEIPGNIIDERRVTLRIMNEWNHTVEGSWSPEDAAHLINDVVPGIRGLTTLDIAAGPISVAPEFGNYQEWYNRFINAGGLQNVPYQSVNLYAHTVEQDLPYFIAVGKPTICTEFNILDLNNRPQWLLDKYNYMRSQGVKSAEIFIIGGQSHGGWPDAYILNEAEAAELGRRPFDMGNVVQQKPKWPAQLPIIKIGGEEFFDCRALFDYYPGRSYKVRPLTAITTMVQHYVGSENYKVPMTIVEALDALWAIHLWHTGQHKDSDKDWAAIGYHGATDGMGRKYLVNDPSLISYHASLANGVGFGWLWLWYHPSSAPPDPMIDASRETHRALQKEYKKPIVLIGHYEAPGNATNCPGKSHWPLTKETILRDPVGPILKPDWYERNAWGPINKGMQALASTGDPTDLKHAQNINDDLKASKEYHK